MRLLLAALAATLARELDRPPGVIATSPAAAPKLIDAFRKRQP